MAEKFKNVGELLDVNVEELIPFLNQEILNKNIQLAQSNAAKNKLAEEYSRLDVEYQKLLKDYQKLLGKIE